MLDFSFAAAAGRPAAPHWDESSRPRNTEPAPAAAAASSPTHQRPVTKSSGVRPGIETESGRFRQAPSKGAVRPWLIAERRGDGGRAGRRPAPAPANDTKDLTMASINTDPDDDDRRPRRVAFAVWRSPLARSTDRTEAGLLLLAVTLWLIALPIVAVVASIIWSGISETATTSSRRERWSRRVCWPTHPTTPTPPSTELRSARRFRSAPNGLVPTVGCTPGRWMPPAVHAAVISSRSGSTSPVRLADPPISTGVAAVLMVVATVASLARLGGAAAGVVVDRQMAAEQAPDPRLGQRVGDHRTGLVGSVGADVATGSPDHPALRASRCPSWKRLLGPGSARSRATSTNPAGARNAAIPVRDQW